MANKHAVFGIRLDPRGRNLLRPVAVHMHETFALAGLAPLLRTFFVDNRFPEVEVPGLPAGIVRATPEKLVAVSGGVDAVFAVRRDYAGACTAYEGYHLALTAPKHVTPVALKDDWGLLLLPADKPQWGEDEDDDEPNLPAKIGDTSLPLPPMEGAVAAKPPLPYPYRYALYLGNYYRLSYLGPTKKGTAACLWPLGVWDKSFAFWVKPGMMQEVPCDPSPSAAKEGSTLLTFEDVEPIGDEKPAVAPKGKPQGRQKKAVGSKPPPGVVVLRETGQTRRVVARATFWLCALCGEKTPVDVVDCSGCGARRN